MHSVNSSIDFLITQVEKRSCNRKKNLSVNEPLGYFDIKKASCFPLKVIIKQH